MQKIRIVSRQTLDEDDFTTEQVLTAYPNGKIWLTEYRLRDGQRGKARRRKHFHLKTGGAYLIFRHTAEFVAEHSSGSQAMRASRAPSDNGWIVELTDDDGNYLRVEDGFDPEDRDTVLLSLMLRKYYKLPNLIALAPDPGDLLRGVMLECEGARGVWTLMIDSDTDSVVVISREGGVYTHQERWELPLLVDQMLYDVPEDELTEDASDGEETYTLEIMADDGFTRRRGRGALTERWKNLLDGINACCGDFGSAAPVGNGPGAMQRMIDAALPRDAVPAGEDTVVFPVAVGDECFVAYHRGEDDALTQIDVRYVRPGVDDQQIRLQYHEMLRLADALGEKADDILMWAGEYTIEELIDACRDDGIFFSYDYSPLYDAT